MVKWINYKDKTKEQLEKLASENDPIALRMMAGECADSGNSQEALELFTRAAEYGDPISMLNLASLQMSALNEEVKEGTNIAPERISTTLEQVAKYMQDCIRIAKKSHDEEFQKEFKEKLREFDHSYAHLPPNLYLNNQENEYIKSTVLKYLDIYSKIGTEVIKVFYAELLIREERPQEAYGLITQVLEEGESHKYFTRYFKGQIYDNLTKAYTLAFQEEASIQLALSFVNLAIKYGYEEATHTKKQLLSVLEGEYEEGTDEHILSLKNGGFMTVGIFYKCPNYKGQYGNDDLGFAAYALKLQHMAPEDRDLTLSNLFGNMHVGSTKEDGSHETLGDSATKHDDEE